MFLLRFCLCLQLELLLQIFLLKIVAFIAEKVDTSYIVYLQYTFMIFSFPTVQKYTQKETHIN